MYKITYSERNLSKALIVGDKDFYELSYKEQKDIIIKLIYKCSEDTLHNILSLICRQMGEYNNYDTYIIDDSLSIQ